MITSAKKLSLAAVSALALAAAIPAGDALADDDVTEYGHDLQASSMASPVASSAADSLESLSGTAFAPLSAPVKYELDDMGRLGVVMLDEGEAARVESITSDGNGGFSVVYVINGEDGRGSIRAGRLDGQRVPQTDGRCRVLVLACANLVW